MSSRLNEPPSSAHPKIAAIYDYWRQTSPGPGLLPGRRHVDPIDIPSLLANIWLLDVIGEPKRFRFRLIGSQIERFGLPAKLGDYLDQFVDKAHENKPVNDPTRVAIEGRPLWYRGVPVIRHDTHIGELERLLLPLAANGRDVDMLLCLSVFYASDGKAIE
jgi:hypothetical protein